jgi:hypothetical protein
LGAPVDLQGVSLAGERGPSGGMGMSTLTACLNALARVADAQEARDREMDAWRMACRATVASGI